MGYEPHTTDDIRRLRERFEDIVSQIKAVEKRLSEEGVALVEVQTATAINRHLVPLEDWSLKIGLEANRSIRDALFARKKKAEFDAEQAVLTQHREAQSSDQRAPETEEIVEPRKTEAPKADAPKKSAKTKRGK